MGQGLGPQGVYGNKFSNLGPTFADATTLWGPPWAPALSQRGPIDFSDFSDFSDFFNLFDFSNFFAFFDFFYFSDFSDFLDFSDFFDFFDFSDWTAI